jgi:universal stress protein A
MQLRTILHPTDFSPYSEYAFQLACSLARDGGARLVVLHVVPTHAPLYGGGMLTLPQPEIEEKLREALCQIRPPYPGIRVEHLLEEGFDASSVIVETARDVRCDLIVMGNHGRTGLLDRLLMGSVAEKVVRQAPCPVLTVKFPSRDPKELSPNEQKSVKSGS